MPKSSVSIRLSGLGLAAGLSVLAAGRTSAAIAVYDPVEPLNRKVFAVNEAVDRDVLSPVARTYVRVVPRSARGGVRNFVTNLSEPAVFVNDVLQANAVRAGVTFGRFGINSTAGVGGLFDVASRIGLRHHDCDLGQTFGKWGVPPGPNLELPILGSSNLRDAFGKGVESFVNPLSYGTDAVLTGIRVGGGVGGLVDGHARLLPVTDKLRAESSDLYVSVRDATAAHRRALVREARAGVEHGPADAAPPLAVPDIAPSVSQAQP